MKITKYLKSKNNTFLFNTFLVIASGFIVKALGLINKIFITRLLGTNGMTLYVLCFPTIILFINLSSFSLNITTSKLVAEGLASKKYSPKRIIKAAIKLAIKVAIIIEILFFLIISILVNKLLKEPNLYIPLLMTAFLIPLVGITDTLRGVFNGYQKIGCVASVNIIEQVSRMLFSIVSIIILSKYNAILAVSATIFALTIGELASLIYLIFKIKKLKIDDFETNSDESKAVWNMSYPTTFSRLIGSFTYFLEPIINTFILLYLGYSKNTIDYNYTLINAYILPMLTITVFLSNALSTTAVPAISEKVSKNEKENTIQLINRIFFLSIIPGILVTILLYNYPQEYLNLFFSTTEGTIYIKKFAIVFLFHYIQGPGIAILQAFGKSKQVMKLCTFFNITKLFLIIILAFIPSFGVFSLFYAILVILILETLSIWFNIHKYSSYCPKKETSLNLLLISILTLSFTTILNKIIVNYLLKSILIISLYSILIIFYLKKEIKPK